MKTIRTIVAAIAAVAIIGGTAVSAQAVSYQPLRKAVVVQEKER